jgi:cyclomaltodextrinase
VRETHPDAYIVGEVIHGDYAGIVRDTSMDAVTQYELWKAIWSALNDRNLFELAHALERHNRFLDTFVPLTFVGNHDVTRIASRLKDDRHLPHALAILFTCGGTPSIYAGDEQAFRGVKEERVGGDDAVRPTFPPTPTALAPCGWSTYRLHQCLIGLRRRYPWLHRARTQQVHLTNEQAVLTISEGSQHLLLAMNLSDETVLLPASNASLIEAGVGELTANADGATQVRIGSHGWAVLSA